MDKISYAVGWLRAIFDGEGHISTNAKRIQISNTSPEVVDDAKKYLDTLGIGFKINFCKRPRPRKDIFRINLGKMVDVKRFILLVGSSIQYKRNGMAQVLRWFRRQGRVPNRYNSYRPTKEEIKELLEKGWRHKQIAEQFNLSITSIQKWRERHGLTQSQNRRKGELPSAYEIRSAYWDEQLSIAQLGERFGYKGTGAARILKKYNIPCRDKSEAHQGQRSGRAKLTDLLVLEIRNAYDRGNVTQCELSSLYGVSNVAISSIVRRKSWKHVPARPATIS